MNHQQIVFLVFAIIVTILFAIDLRSLFRNPDKEVSNKHAMLWTFTWIFFAMMFSIYIYIEDGLEKFSQFQSAYWIEQSLSVDNLFVFLMVFKYFKTTGLAQHKILVWGIIGAIIFRAIFIFSGTWLIELTDLPPFWYFGAPGPYDPINIIILCFGIMLLYGGIKTFFSKIVEETSDFNNSIGAKLVRKVFKVVDISDEKRFWTRPNGKLFATKLLLVLVVVETTDLVFAVDSIPAIFSIAPKDPLILYTSNIFAIFGLRSMYFLLANSMDKFEKLQYGIAFILVFIGIKMIISPMIPINTMISLTFILVTLLVSILFSLRSTK